MSKRFNNWLDTFISEKELNTDTVLEAEGASGTNYIPLEILIDMMKQTSYNEQIAIRDTIVKIDFHNGDVMHYFNHLAGAIAI